MTQRKERLTVTVDPSLVEAGNDAVAEGRVESLSAWVNAALAAKVATERRLAALGRAVASYEREFGVLTAQELVDQVRADRESAIVVRGKPSTGRAKKRRRGRA
jgi:hypothetical protein